MRRRIFSGTYDKNITPHLNFAPLLEGPFSNLKNFRAFSALMPVEETKPILLPRSGKEGGGGPKNVYEEDCASFAAVSSVTNSKELFMFDLKY
jgi:hypothetical protein